MEVNHPTTTIPTSFTEFDVLFSKRHPDELTLNSYHRNDLEGLKFPLFSRSVSPDPEFISDLTPYTTFQQVPDAHNPVSQPQTPQLQASDSNHQQSQLRGGRQAKRPHAASASTHSHSHSPSPTTPNVAQGFEGGYNNIEDEEERKRLIKRQKNNEAAYKCRMKKKQFDEENAKKVKILQAENDKLRKELDRLKAESNCLKEVIVTLSAKRN